MTAVIAPVLGELDRWLLAEGTHRRAYQKLGAHPTRLGDVDGTAFAVWAPNARRVTVVGDFNYWNPDAHPLVCFGAPGVWEGFVPGALAGHSYKLCIDGPDGRRLPLKADPFALRSESFPGTSSIVHGLREYDWHDGDWMRGRGGKQRHVSPISIYEVHLGSWRLKPDGTFLNYRDVGQELARYASDLGFTHVELLPLNEHPLYASWGYQPLGLFSPTGRYGLPEDLKAFVEALHAAGVGVILDWVPAHFPRDEHGLSLFDGTHLYEHADPRQGSHPDWGTLVYNYGRNEVQNFLIANALYWMDEFHIDGIRVDAVASMLHLDYSRRPGEWVPNRYGGRENLEAAQFLKRLNEVVYGEFPDAMTLAEESTTWPGVTRPTSAGGLGFGFKWNMGWMHDTRDFLKIPMPARSAHQDLLTFSMSYKDSENYVLPLSHDEVVHGKLSLLVGMAGTREEQFANLRLWYAWQWIHAGKKLLFMGGEFAQDREWVYDSMLDWHLLAHAPHVGVQNVVRDLNRLYRTTPALYEGETQPSGFSFIDAEDRAGSVLTVLRRGDDDDALVVAVLNFSGVVHDGYRVGVPLPGKWLEVMNTDAAHYGGNNVGNMGGVTASPVARHGCAQSLEITVPALGALFFAPDPESLRRIQRSQSSHVRLESNAPGDDQEEPEDERLPVETLP
jgi:1,4-alpha-glucan branching enzyme